MHEILRGIQGIIKVRMWPNYIDPHSEDDWREWWPRLTERERDRLNAPLIDEDGHEVEYVHNLLTNLGITATLKLLSFSAQAQLQPFATILSVGNGAISGVTRGDTAVAGDGFGTNARRAPNTDTFTGNQTDIGTNFLSTDAVGTWTNAGLYGYRYSDSTVATTTTGSGQLNSHVMFSFVKPSTACTVDYIIIVSN